MVKLSQAFNPPVLKGIKVHPDNPFKFEFVLSQGDNTSPEAKGESALAKGDFLKQESTKLIKYFLASLTVPEKDLWVNLSPYEKDRIVPDAFGKTEMGRDLLAQDYILKQITASMIYPEDEVGKKFWKRVYEEAGKKLGTTNVPVNTFNKVWIVPEKAVVYENAKSGTAYVVESKLKVMLEEDYLATQNNQRQPGDMTSVVSPSTLPSKRGLQPKAPQVSTVTQTIIREIIIPQLYKEINQGQNFAQLRQVYNSLILATWYKKKIKNSILAQVYADQYKIKGTEYQDSIFSQRQPGDMTSVVSPSRLPTKESNEGESIPGHQPTDVEAIYQHYLQAFKKGAYNYIKEEQDPITRQPIPRKYFSGGTSFDGIRIDPAMPTQVPHELLRASIVKVNLVNVESNPSIDHSMASIQDILNKQEFQDISWKRVGPFYSLYTPWRKNRRQSDKPYESVTAPFDQGRFHFINPDQPLGWNFNEKDIFWEGDFEGVPLAFVKQIAPFAPKHFLILPERLSRRPQLIEAKDIKLALGLVALQPFKGFRIGFNGLRAGASVNHLHLQGLQLPENRSALEEAPLGKLFSFKGANVSLVKDYPAIGLFFGGQDQESIITLAYKYIRYLQRSEISHSIIFTPQGVYVMPEKSNYLTTFGNTWTFYEMLGFIANFKDDVITQEQINKELADVTLGEEEFLTSYHEAFEYEKVGVGLYYPDRIGFKPLVRQVTHGDANGSGDILPAFHLLLGRVDHEEMKTLIDFPVIVELNQQRANRKSAWNKIEQQHDCPLCGLLEEEKGHLMGVGHGFVAVKEEYPYFDQTASIVQMDHQAPILDRGLVESMAQMLYELGPLGFRIAYNHEGSGQKILHQSYKLFQKEMPIESAPSSRIMTFPDIVVNAVHDFPTQALILETKKMDILVNELVRMDEFLKLLRIPFNVFLTLREDGTIRAFIILRKGDQSVQFKDKIFGVVESAGVLLLEKEEDFNDMHLRERVINAYKDITISEYEMKKVLYVYKMHMALGHLGIKHHLEYEIDTTGSVFYVCRILGAGEVVKALKKGFSEKGNRSYEWKNYFETGYQVTQKLLGGLISPIKGVDIDEQGQFIPSDDPDYLIQQLVPGDPVWKQINDKLQKLPMDISGIVQIFERIVKLRTELMRRGTFDIDSNNIVGNLIGNAEIGFDTSHIRDAFGSVNLFGDNGYAEDFEEQFNRYISRIEQDYPLLGKALRERFGYFTWKEELRKAGVQIPPSAQERLGEPMPAWESKIVLLSKLDETKVGAIFMMSEKSMRNFVLSNFWTPLSEGAQYIVRKSLNGQFVLKVEKTLEETRNIRNLWPSFLQKDEQKFNAWANDMHVGKSQGYQIVQDKLSHSQGIYPVTKVLDLEYRLLDDNGNTKLEKVPIALLQVKAEFTLGEALKNFVQEGNEEKIKTLLRQVILTIKEELWAYGVFDNTFAITVNWGVDEVGKDNPHVRLFDFGELITDKARAIKRLSDLNDYIEWVILGDNPFSIESLTHSKELAYWFSELVQKELSVQELEKIWGIKEVGEKLQDKAQLPKKGGIDLTANKTPLEVKLDVSSTRKLPVGRQGIGNDEGIQFKIDPVMLKKYQNASGFVPVIINIEPLMDLRLFLGIKEDNKVQEARSS